MKKNKILAICGASATGKDSLSKWMKCAFAPLGIDAGNIISSTTRPQRPTEIDGWDYNFCSPQDFVVDECRGKFLETTFFNGWFYGTSKESLKYDINIGVFNPEGIYQLNNREDIDLFIVYLKEPLTKRLKRSCEREGRARFEFFRRIIADYYAFKDFELYLTNVENYVIIDQIDGVVEKANKLISYMNYNNIFLGES